MNLPPDPGPRNLELSLRDTGGSVTFPYGCETNHFTVNFTVTGSVWAVSMVSTASPVLPVVLT